jgi:hyaluronoglucosaminidase
MKTRFFGVVEGFYRSPYTFQQRLDLITFLSDCGLNTYVYGPKADRFHKKEWYKPYPAVYLKEFEQLSEHSKRYNVQFNVALSPMERPRVDAVRKKIHSLLRIGITDFSLFFDDINVPLTTEVAERQVVTANRLYEFLMSENKRARLFFCPTQYRGFERTAYINAVAQKLKKSIYMFWTGRRVVSTTITAEDIDTITKIIKRPPLIWDNFFANDYVPYIIFKFPYRNRDPDILTKVRGILINPMNDYHRSMPLIYTAAQFFQDPYGYDERRAWNEARRIQIRSLA